MSPMNVRGANKTHYESDRIRELVTSAMSERGDEPRRGFGR